MSGKRAVRVEADAVVGNIQCGAVRVVVQPQQDGARVGMLYYVVQRLLYDAEQRLLDG